MIRDNYDALTLRVYDELYLHYERPLKCPIQAHEEMVSIDLKNFRQIIIPSIEAYF